MYNNTIKVIVVDLCVYKLGSIGLWWSIKLFGELVKFMGKKESGQNHFCKYDMQEILIFYIYSSLCLNEISEMIESFDNGL